MDALQELCALRNVVPEKRRGAALPAAVHDVVEIREWRGIFWLC